MKKLVYLISFFVMPCLIQAQNYFAGTNAGLGNTGTNNTAVGATALSSSNSGSYNAAFGASSLRSNTSGYSNTASGGLSLYANTTGYKNTASGYGSLNANISGANNTAMGYNSLNANLSGNNNTASGGLSLYGNTIGYNNTAAGYSSMQSNTTGFNNTALGYNSLKNNSTGSENVAVGNGAGNGGVSPNNNNQCTFLGASAWGNNLTNATAVGYGTQVNASNKVVIGNTSVTSIGGQVGWTVYSDRRLKTNINKSTLGLNFILQLNPVTYTYNAEGQKDILYTGLLAQEVDAAAQKTGTIFSAVDKNGEYWGIRYAELTVPLISSVQELNEKAIATEKENLQLKKEIEKLYTALENLKTAVENLQQSSKNIQSETKASASLLFQNQPNPFSQQTTITYQLQPTDKNAAIVIRHINGSIVKQISITNTGNGKVIINPNELAAGAYTYSLLTNSGIADTKLMIITK